METLKLIHTQLALESIGLDHRGMLVRIAGPNPDDIAGLYCYYFQQRYQLYFRHDIRPELRRQIQQLSPQRVFIDHKFISDILGTASTEMGHYQSYTFKNNLHPDLFPDVLMQEHNQQTTAVILRDGIVASACTSARENDVAGECYVYTEPAYGGQGFAKQTAAAWGYQLLQRGKIAFYSHKRNNHASKGVAQSLGLVPRFELVNYG